LTRSARPLGKVVDGKTTLSYGWGFKGFWLFFGVLALCILATIPFVKVSDRISVVLLALLFGGLSMPMLLRAFMVRVIFSSDGIEAYSPWRKPKFVPWGDVSQFNYSYSGCLRIDTSGTGRLVLTRNISGLASILEELRRRKVKEII
jgi:hypothetical protein